MLYYYHSTFDFRATQFQKTYLSEYHTASTLRVPVSNLNLEGIGLIYTVYTRSIVRIRGEYTL